MTASRGRTENSPEGSWWSRFRDLLDAQNEWPSEYLFKFIAPSARVEDLKAVFGDHPITIRSSSRGNYLSVTARMMMVSSNDVIRIYEAAGRIDGVVSL